LNRKLAALCLWLAALAPAGFCGEPMTGASKALGADVSASGGGISSSASFALLSSVGEPVTEPFSGAARRLRAGYAPLSSQPGTITSLAAVSKSTGSLELEWSAPGADGFLGRVSNGFYRVDLSQDPLHSFAPTAFTAERSTSASPGERHRLSLSGLSPNTTYYAHVYLGDDGKVFAEDSAPGAESTLANVPASPVLSGVFASSVTFVWNLPAGGAAGFTVDASSSGYVGGSVFSTTTHSGAAVTLTVTGLSYLTTYHFRLGSLNWQDDRNFTTLIATCTRLGGPLPIEDLASVPNALGKTVSFTWTVKPYADPDGVLVQMSTSPIVSDPANGTAYAQGSAFPDGSVVAASSAASSHLSAGLLLDATYYFRFFAHDTSKEYSTAVSTAAFLDLAPMAPAGLASSLNQDGTRITIRWSPVSSNLDGTPFRLAAALSRIHELSHYDVYRATGILRPTWVWVASAPAAASECSAEVPDPSEVYFYRVDTRDAYSPKDRAMAVDTLHNVYALGQDGVTRFMVPASLTGTLRPEGNSEAAPLLARVEERGGDVGDRVVKSVSLDVFKSPGNETWRDFRFPYAGLDVAMRYEVAGGVVQPSAFTSAATAATALKPAVSAMEASRWLGAYWHNGREYVRMFGNVDESEQTVRLQSALPGAYQIRTMFRTDAVSLDLREISNKVITPNGDGRNDYVVFRLENPRDSSLSGAVYDLRGAHVADMRPGAQVADSLTWDGTSNGRAVSRGVYIYQIKAEDRVFNGTILVIR